MSRKRSKSYGNRKRHNNTFTQKVILIAIVIVMGWLGIDKVVIPDVQTQTLKTIEQPDQVQVEDYVETVPVTEEGNISLSDIPEFSDRAYVVINDNIPFFTDEELTTTSFETYSELDNLGRCVVAYASIGVDIMPTKEREGIGMVKPAGWHTIKYDCVDGKYLYNRCHLIGYQLAGENANVQNLITGTRYLNTKGMLPFENEVADYVKKTNNHVQYRVTPIYEGENLLASGVQIEAKSVEDQGAGVQYNVYCYNSQPDVNIDYATGDSWQSFVFYN